MINLLNKIPFVRQARLMLMLCFFSCFFLIDIFAQRGDCKEIKNKQAINLYQQAIANSKFKYKESIKLLREAVKIEPDFADAYYMLGELNYRLANKNELQNKEMYFRAAEDNFLKVVSLCPSFNYYASSYYLGDYYYQKRKFEKSGFFLHQFLDNNKENSKLVYNAKKMVKNVDYYLDLINNPVPFNPKPLADICTNRDEYLPLISPDEELMIFSRRTIRFAGSSHEKSEEKLNLSIRLWEDSAGFVFSRGRPMESPFNDGRNQGGATITIDNNHIFITICEFERADYTSYKNCDIFSSDRKNGKWSPLRRLGTNINGASTFEGMPSITADGKTLYFSSAREGGYGGLDIYKSEKDEFGKWGKAQNLGPVINTAGDEKTPFIHSDSQTLYFSTNGIFGLGGFDIFYSQYLGHGQWTEPKNIGYPINTDKDELGLMVSANGKNIFFSSRAYNETGDWDIYIATLYEKARPQRVLFVKGKLYDEEGKTIKKAKVELVNIKTDELTEGFVDDNSGNYAVAVPVNKGDEFIMTAKKKGFFFNSIYINPEDEKYDPPTTLDFKVQKIDKNKRIILKNVNFKTGSDELNELSKSVLDVLVDFLKENHEVKISLLGYTDNEGDADYNLDLSLRRTKSVKKYLVSKGINTNRISVYGYGEKRPIASNRTSYGRSLNRRVEFIIK